MTADRYPWDWHTASAVASAVESNPGLDLACFFARKTRIRLIPAPGDREHTMALPFAPN